MRIFTTMMVAGFLALSGCAMEGPGVADDVASQTSAVESAPLPDENGEDMRMRQYLLHLCFGGCDDEQQQNSDSCDSQFGGPTTCQTPARCAGMRQCWDDALTQALQCVNGCNSIFGG